MTLERDLPCADCGTDLRERTLPASELPLTDAEPSPADVESPADAASPTNAEPSPVDAKSPTDAGDQHVTVADCPACGARYYPADALARLAATTGPQRTEEGS